MVRHLNIARVIGQQSVIHQMASDRRRVAGGSGNKYELVKEAIRYVSFLVYIFLSLFHLLPYLWSNQPMVQPDRRLYLSYFKSCIL